MANSVYPYQTAENGKQFRPWSDCLEKMANSVYPDETDENGK